MKKTISLETSHSSHSKCFVCFRKNKKLIKISKSSIAFAYLKRRIIITHHARCCGTHLNQNGDILEKDLYLIKTKTKQYDVDIIKIMDSVTQLPQLTDKCGIFDDFKNINTIDEAQCFKITRWTKQEFVDFSNYITSINLSKGRTKGELIALYRFWMNKVYFLVYDYFYKYL